MENSINSKTKITGKTVRLTDELWTAIFEHATDLRKLTGKKVSENEVVAEALTQKFLPCNKS